MASYVLQVVVLHMWLAMCFKWLYYYTCGKLYVSSGCTTHVASYVLQVDVASTHVASYVLQVVVTENGDFAFLLFIGQSYMVTAEIVCREQLQWLGIIQTP